MKKLTTLLLIGLFFLAFPTDAKPPAAAALQQKIQQRVNEQPPVSQQEDDLLPTVLRHEQISSLLQKQQRFVVLQKDVPAFKEAGFLPAKEITWDQVERNMAQLRSQKKQEQAAYKQDEQLYSKILVPEEAVQIIQQLRSDLPDYEKLTKHKKYIYIAETSAHELPSIIKEGQRILRQVRQANPGARILLALEMAVLVDQGNPPLLPYDAPNASVYIVDEYAGLADTARRNDIDILALEDHLILSTNTPKTYLAKVGDYAVRFNTTANYVKNFVRGYEKEAQQYPALVVQDLLARSDWGVLQRNKQWVNYIRTVENFYDIIIVYAGDGHLNVEDKSSVPNLLAKNGILLDIASAEELPPNLQQFYDCAEKTQCKFNLSTDEELTPDQLQIFLAMSAQMQPFLEQLDKGKPFWVEFYWSKPEARQRMKQYIKPPKLAQALDALEQDKTLPYDIKEISIVLPDGKK